jgi:hypothetical protein
MLLSGVRYSLHIFTGLPGRPVKERRLPVLYKYPRGVSLSRLERDLPQWCLICLPEVQAEALPTLHPAQTLAYQGLTLNPCDFMKVMVLCCTAFRASLRVP